MNMRTNITRVLCFLALIAAPVLLAFAAGGGAKPAGPHPCCHKQLEAAAPLPDRSIYQVESKWSNDASNTVSLSSLRGKPQIVAMFFAQCQFTCPILVHSMKQIEAELPDNVRTNVGFLLVSFDSERDTPQALARYRQTHQLGPNWTLLKGNPDDVLELSALLGVKFKQDPSGNFAHSNLITLLNAEGEIAFQEIGINRDPLPMINAAQKLLSNGK